MAILRHFFLFLLLTISTLSSKILKCPSNVNKCYCSEFGELEIQCPKFDPRIYVRIQPNNFLNFDCENSTDSDYDLVPEIELPEAQMIKITRCPLPHGRSLASYFKNIHVEKILWLQIFSGGVNSRIPLESTHLKGFEDITRFLISGNENEFRELPSDLFTNMKKIAWITMRVGNIQLPVDIFAPLQNLEFLELGHNKMTTLEPGLLRMNNKLQQLNLWGNNLRNLDKEAFKGLENLRELDLSTNGMESLEPDLFMYLTNLTHLNLGGNKFATLPEGLFANNRKMVTFKMLENRVPLDNLPNGLLANQSLLEHVYIKCDLRKIPEDIFEESPNIISINLDGNQLEVLPKYLFKDQDKLNMLDLSNNFLTDLPEELFERTQLLKTLYLSHNRIERIPKINNINHLKLRGNNCYNQTELETDEALVNSGRLDLIGIENLTPELLLNFLNLTHLELGCYNFSSLSDKFLKNTRKLTIFKMVESHRSLEKLPSRLLSNQKMLQQVHIKSNLKEISGVIFEGSKSILSINFAGNLLQNLPKNIFEDLKMLRLLDLSENLLNNLPEELFEETTRLKKLNLSHNKISHFPRHIFQPLKKLTELHLNNNQLTTLHGGVFEGIRSIKVLNLANNRLKFETELLIIDEIEGINETLSTDVASRFQGLENLEDLNLRNNSIMSMFEDYTLTSLKRLDMSYNNLTILSSSDIQIFNSRHELTIDLSHNNIEHIDFKGYRNEESSASLTVMLDNNPIICDCHILYFVKYLSDQSKKNNFAVNMGSLSCTSPDFMYGRHVKTVQPLELLCPLDEPSSNMEKRCPSTCSVCNVRPEDKTLLLNCYGNVSTSALPNASNMSLHNVELRIEGQNLTEVPSSSTPGYQQITKLFLADNDIHIVGELPMKLTHLDLQNNNIDMLNESTLMMLNYSTSLKEMKLSGNPWRCDCSNLAFINFVQKYYKLITDYSDMRCSNGQPVNELTASGLCSEENFIIIIASIIFAILSLIIGVLAALYYKYQKQIKMWLYAHNILLWFVTEEELDKDRTYDAFLSYAHQDADFISDHLVPQLENCVVPYKLCFHERDFLPGLEISTQISNSINDSKRTIVVMSPHYLASNWGQWEFRVAQSQAATEKRSRIIVILYGDIGDVSKLEPEIRDYLKLNTYVKWGDKWFWEKLLYAMPHVKGQGPLDRSKGLVKTAIKSSVDDKLELIKPVSVTPPQLTTPPAEQIANPLVTKLNAKNAAKNHNGYSNGHNGHLNGAYVINTSSRQSDV